MDNIQVRLELMYDYLAPYDLLCEASGDAKYLLDTTKQVIHKIVSDIKRFFVNLSQKIGNYLMNKNLSKTLKKVQRLEKNHPKFRTYKIECLDMDRYAKAYNDYMGKLKALNIETEPDEKYTEKVESIYDDFTFKRDDIINEGVFIATIPQVVNTCRAVLISIHTNGIRSYPEPKNTVIARAFAKASIECGKMVSTAIKQLTSAISENRLRLFADDISKMIK